MRRSLRRSSGRVASARGQAQERLYVIKGFTYGGTLIYTKGKIARQAGREIFYVFVSAKIATYAEGN